MGKRGPAPAPTALKLLRGERHQDRINRDEPKPRVALPVADEDLVGEVREVWDGTVSELAAMNLAHACDTEALRAYCEAVVIHRRASREMAHGDLLVVGVSGNMIRNPALVVQRDAAQTLLRFAQEFGLTPSSRSAIKAAEAPGAGDENPFASSG